MITNLTNNKSLTDIRHNGIMLRGIIDGLDALIGNEQGRAQNAILPMIEKAQQMGDQLVSDLEHADMPATEEQR